MVTPRFHHLLASGLLIALTAGCRTASKPSESDASISPGAMTAPIQDESYEIKGKPQTGGGTQAGFGGPGGEVNPQAMEQQAIAPQIHYHHHVHNHYHSNGAVYSVPGYAHTSYMVPHHAPMPAYSSPYSHSPNGGNPVGPQGNGPWNQGGYRYPGGGMPQYNPWINGGAGGMTDDGIRE